MSWRDIKANWEADQTFRDAYDEDYPFASVALAVTRLRAANDLTQGELAKLVGTTQSVISRLESGRHAVSTEMLRRVSKALGQDWEPVFRPAGAASAMDLKAANEVVVSAAPIRVTARVFDRSVYLLKWPDSSHLTAPRISYWKYDKRIDSFVEEEEATPASVPVAAAWGADSGLFSNQPLARPRGSQTVPARH